MPRMPKTPFAKQFDALEARFENKRLVREIGAAVRKMRSETNWRQAEVAQSIRTSQATISRIERDVTVRPRWDALECIAANLRYKLLLDGGVRVRKKPSWKRSKHKTRYGHAPWPKIEHP